MTGQEKDRTPANGTIWTLDQGGEQPSNSKLIVLVDANIFRRFVHLIHPDILEFIPEEKRITGRYLDLLLWFGQAPMVHRVMTTGTVEYECTHRIGRTKIEIGKDYPEFEDLYNFFHHVRHIDWHHNLIRTDEARPETDFYDSRIEVIHLPGGNYLRQVGNMYDDYVRSGEKRLFDDRGIEGEKRRILTTFIGFQGHNIGEISSKAYAVEERGGRPGPAYFLSADVKGREVFTTRHTPYGSAIGFAGPAGFLKAMLVSGFLHEHVLTGNAPPAEDMFGIIRKDINKQCKAADGTKQAIARFGKGLDEPGVYRDGTEGINLQDRLSGKAVWWSPHAPSSEVEVVDKVQRSEPGRGKGKP